MTERSLRKTVHRLIGEDKPDEARRLVQRELSSLPSGSRHREGALLNVLFGIEMYSERPSSALNVLARRHSLGFRIDCALAFDATLLSARLLMDDQQWFAARAKLTELLS